MELKVVIDGEEIELVPRGQYQGCEKFTGPKEISGLMATVYVRPDWTPGVPLPTSKERLGTISLKTLNTPLDFDFRACQFQKGGARPGN